MVAATIVIEAVFFLPGLGRLTLSALTDGDRALLRGGALAMIAVATIAALIGDVVRAFLGGAEAPRMLPPLLADSPPNLRFGFWLGLLIVLGLCGLSAAAQFWTPFPAGLAGETAAPSMMQPFGTDAAGREMFAAVMAGLGTSVTVAAISVAIGVILGVPIGLMTGVAGGPPAWATLRIGDAVIAIPVLIIAIALFPAIGANAVNTTILLGLMFVPPIAVAVHGAVQLRLGRGYVAAARLAGLSSWSVASRHVFPELGRTIAAKAAALLGTGMLAETVLSFAGLGVRAPTASIGLLLADAQARFLQFPHLALIPGAVLLVFVVAVNLIADALEPEPQRQGGADAIT
jgi:peptide/nickel transport system permease protein